MPGDDEAAAPGAQEAEQAATTAPTSSGPAGGEKRARADDTGGDKKQGGKRQRKDGAMNEAEAEQIAKVVLRSGDSKTLKTGVAGFLLTCQALHERAAVARATKALAPALPQDTTLVATSTACGGCVLLLACGDDAGTTAVDACKQLLLTTADLEAGGRTARACPVQTTCAVTEDALTAAAQRLTATRLQAEKPADGAAFTFAVLYHSRGHIDADDKLDRLAAVKAAAAGVEAACKAASVPYKVNLSQPDAALMVEVMPVVVGEGSKTCVIAALTLLPAAMLCMRPKLSIRQLCVG